MKMHWCTGRINLSGQNFTILVIDKLEPISWPEAQVLMALHGEENVYDLKPCAISEIAGPRTEKNRLLLKYGLVVEKVFPGHTPRMEALMPGEPQDQPHADAEGKPDGNGNGDKPAPTPAPDDDEDEDEATRGADPPAGPAVFKPGRHQPPHKGA
jgi:hypothetical protein